MNYTEEDYVAAKLKDEIRLGRYVRNACGELEWIETRTATYDEWKARMEAQE